MMTMLPMSVKAELIADCLLQGEAAERGVGGTDDLCALPWGSADNLRLGRLLRSSSSGIPSGMEMKAKLAPPGRKGGRNA
jgi:hypothetical protein